LSVSPTKPVEKEENADKIPAHGVITSAEMGNSRKAAKSATTDGSGE
jgi:hypothetical protein